MKPATKHLLQRGTLLLAALALLPLLLTPLLAGATTPHHPVNHDWDGGSRFATALLGTPPLQPGSSDGHLVVRDLTHHDLPPGATVLLVAPQDPFTEAESQALADLLQSGGTVVVADETTTSNPLLERLGSTTRVQPGPVRDLAYSKQPAFVATNPTPHELTRGVTTLVLNHASTLQPDPGATVLAETGNTSWLDHDGNDQPTPGEPRGPFPVLATQRIGPGTLVVLSDPSVLLNTMATAGDDARFQANLAQRPAPRVLDLSHDATPDPLGVLAGFTRDHPVVLTAALPLVLAPLAWGRRLARQPFTLLRRLLTPNPDPGSRLDRVLDRVQERNPAWSREELERFTTPWRRSP